MIGTRENLDSYIVKTHRDILITIIIIFVPVATNEMNNNNNEMHAAL